MDDQDGERYADAVQDYERAGVIDTDHRAWGAVVGFGGVADGDGLLCAVEGFVVNQMTDYVTDAAAALRYFGRGDVAAVVERALAEYQAAGGVLDEQQWEAFAQEWDALTGGDIIGRIGESLSR